MTRSPVAEPFTINHKQPPARAVKAQLCPSAANIFCSISDTSLGSSKTCQASVGTPLNAFSNRAGSFFSASPSSAMSVALRMNTVLIHPGYLRYLQRALLAYLSALCSVLGYRCARPYISPYASGSDCVESPNAIIFLFGSHELIFFIRSTLYSSVPSVRLDSRPEIVLQLESRRIMVPPG